MEQRELVEALRTDSSVRQICETLGFTRSNLYYQPKQAPCEEGLRDEIETLVPCGIRNMDIGVSQNSYCVWDTPLGIAVLRD